MSQEAVDLVQEQLNQNDGDVVDFDTMVRLIEQQCNVSEKTAASYIYDADTLIHEWSADGDHVVKEATQANVGGSLIEDGDRELEVEAGAPAGEDFEYLAKLEDVNHPLVPEKTPYYRRRMEGHKSDIQVITHDLSDQTPLGKQHVLLTGLPGVGKNQAVKHICAETNRPLIRVPVGGGIRYEDLVGHYSPTPEGGLEWVDGILTTAVRYGYTVVLDEIDMMTGDVSSPLHQVTEDGDSQELVIRQTGEVVEPHPQFRVVATRNPGFAGANQMNRAFLSRFSEHEVGYLSEDAEVKVLTNEIPGLNAADIRPVVEYANELRERYPQELDLVVTTRDLKRIGGYLADDLFDTKNAVRKVLLPRADPDTDRDPLTDEIDMRF